MLEQDEAIASTVKLASAIIVKLRGVETVGDWVEALGKLQRG